MKHIGRKLYHLLGGLALLSLSYICRKEQALVLYASIFLVVLLAEIVRLTIPAVNRVLVDRFQSFIRHNETNRITGTAPYVLGIGLTILLFRLDIATAAICFLIFGDVSATTIGERFGKTRIGKKSLEGTLAFVVASIGAGFLLSFFGIIFLPYGLILVGAITAAGTELLPLPVNDNLVIPVVSGGIMELIARVSGIS